MYRTIYEDLIRWKNDKNRMPLLLEGVRQCGKTYVLREFGEKNYKNVVYFNFEHTPDISDIFQPDLDPKRIITRLSLLKKEKIEPGKTLIIFDEIQFCNRALTSLKYFCEDAPDYHVACAGSLLGVMLSQPYSFPVGKVDRLKMGPMSFKEFLLANSEDRAIEYMEPHDPTEQLIVPLVSKLKEYLDIYCLVGGMPAAIKKWMEDRDMIQVERILDGIISSYMDDFSTHASEHLTKLTMIWKSIPLQLAKDNKKFIFSHVKTGSRSKDLEDALEWLVNAGLVHRVNRVDPPQVPLPMYVDNTNFKIYLADIGILRRMAGLESDYIFSKSDEFDLYKGMMMENYVLNELIASTGNIPYYWRSNGIAEVDFVAQIKNKAIPIEVKSGKNTTSKSLSEYVKRFSPAIAIKVSMLVGRSGKICNIPLYSAWMIAEYVRRS